ncbi:hypothetical protein BaRGS_00032311 [Batillaria attramentaria]|uniref:Uncharacterized protein n=1 Tax=Batillaria attramentaria TaxID=370345 RepID=A0ABD0JP35_9CAEN
MSSSFWRLVHRDKFKPFWQQLADTRGVIKLQEYDPPQAREHENPTRSTKGLMTSAGGGLEALLLVLQMTILVGVVLWRVLAILQDH